MGVVTAERLFTGVGEDFGPRKGTLLFTLHTTENSDPLKNTVRDAIALATWQDRDDTLGSYNRLICTDGVLRTVPDDHASGGVNPGSAYFSPRPWLWTMLPAEAVRDPNAWGPNLSAMGQRAWYDINGWPAAIIDGFARSIIEMTPPGVNPVISNHADWQPGNRTDAGNALALVMTRLEQLEAAGIPTPWTEVPTVSTDWIRTAKPFSGRGRLKAGAYVYSFPALSAATPRFQLAIDSEVDFTMVWEGDVEYAGSKLWYGYMRRTGGTSIVPAATVTMLPPVDPLAELKSALVPPLDAAAAALVDAKEALG